MKLLCPIDFSPCSLNAVKWILDYYNNSTNIEVEILHCVDERGAVKLYQAQVEFDKKQAIINMKDLLKQLHEDYPQYKLSTSVMLANPKTYVIDRAVELNADLIVMGSTGLNSLKDITIGSVTEYIVDRTNTPMLCIPDNISFSTMDKVVIGLDDLEIKQPKVMEQLSKFIEPHNPRLYLCQVKNKVNNDDIMFDFRIEDFIPTDNIEAVVLPKDVTVSNTINAFALKNNIDMVCFIHRKRTWIKDLFHHSNLKDGLYDLEYPFLIISD